MAEINEEENFEKLKQLITNLIGFDCSQYSDSFLKRRIEVRLRALNIKSFFEYSKILKSSEEERDKLHKELTIHVTNLFRDKSMWDLFKDRVIPAVVNNKNQKNQKTIRVWSAGCSSGEEPLSIAISFFEALGPNLRGFDVKINGTDMEPAVVEKAKAALYEELQFREAPSNYKGKYFEKQGDLYKAKKEILDLTYYSTGNILSALKPKNMDIIFCRNTVIYFKMDAKSKLYNEFYESLNQGGFFIMGKTEVMQGPAREKFKLFDSKEHVYTKE